MPQNKSLGTDRIPVEFYLNCWPALRKSLSEAFNFSFVNGRLSFTPRQGIITLIPKKERKMLHLANWCPISVLNHNYTILTKCLAERIKPLLKNLIHPDQTSFILGQFNEKSISEIRKMSRPLPHYWIFKRHLTAVVKIVYHGSIAFKMNQ